MIKSILVLIGLAQITSMLLALGFAIGRVSELEKWKIPDFFWMSKMEKLFVKLLSKIK